MKPATLFAALLVLAAAATGCATNRPAESSLSGSPSWFPLGGEVNHEQDRIAAAKKTLSFRDEPRWFLPSWKVVDQREYAAYQEAEAKRAQAAHVVSVTEESPPADGRYRIPADQPYPTKLDDLPRENQGATLAFKVLPTSDPRTLTFVLTLAARDRDVWREVEHRSTNILPFLFAFYADGKAVRPTLRDWMKHGGANWQVPLVRKGQQETWTLSVDAASLDALLADPNVKTLAVVAAFSERQHEGYFAHDQIQRLRHEQETIRDGRPPPPPVLVRSAAVRLERIDGTWRSKRK